MCRRLCLTVFFGALSNSPVLHATLQYQPCVRHARCGMPCPCPSPRRLQAISIDYVQPWTPSCTTCVPLLTTQTALHCTVPAMYPSPYLLPHLRSRQLPFGARLPSCHAAVPMHATAGTPNLQCGASARCSATISDSMLMKCMAAVHLPFCPPFAAHWWRCCGNGRMQMDQYRGASVCTFRCHDHHGMASHLACLHMQGVRLCHAAEWGAGPLPPAHRWHAPYRAQRCMHLKERRRMRCCELLSQHSVLRMHICVYCTHVASRRNQAWDE